MKKSTYTILAGISVLSIGIACNSAPNEGTPEDIKRLNDHAQSQKSIPPVATQATKVINGGDWEVGTKENISQGVILPGTYIITALETGYGCYYETVKDFDQNLDSIISNGNVDPGQTARVVVKKTYAGLSLKGDCLAVRKK